MTEVENRCKWIQSLETKIREYPDKFPDYVMESGQLYWNLGDRVNDEDNELCVPSTNKTRALQECHNALSAGHLGFRKTVTRLTQRYFWSLMFTDAKRYVRRCESCQKLKTTQTKAAGKMLTRETSEPIDILCTDFVGPLPRPKQGNTMLLVFHDAFPKCVELVLLRKATTALQKAFRGRVLCRFPPKIRVGILCHTLGWN